MPKLTPGIKAVIDSMSFESMLTLWRRAPVGHKFFQEEIGKYFLDVMLDKKEAIGHDAAVAISKRIGWEREEY